MIKYTINDADQQMLEDLFEAFERGIVGLSTWEEDFIESIQEQWDVKGSLTLNQLQKARDIWVKI